MEILTKLIPDRILPSFCRWSVCAHRFLPASVAKPHFPRFVCSPFGIIPIWSRLCFVNFHFVLIPFLLMLWCVLCLHRVALSVICSSSSACASARASVCMYVCVFACMRARACMCVCVCVCVCVCERERERERERETETETETERQRERVFVFGM